MRRLAAPAALARLALAAAPVLAGCAGRGITFAQTHPSDPTLVLSCARSIAIDQGLDEVTVAKASLELQAESSVDMPTRDVLTVTLSPAKKGFDLLVGGTSSVLRQLRGPSSDAKGEWVGTTPSARVGTARDAILKECGSLGS